MLLATILRPILNLIGSVSAIVTMPDEVGGRLPVPTDQFLLPFAFAVGMIAVWIVKAGPWGLVILAVSLVGHS